MRSKYELLIFLSTEYNSIGVVVTLTPFILLFFGGRVYPFPTYCQESRVWSTTQVPLLQLLGSSTLDCWHRSSEHPWNTILQPFVFGVNIKFYSHELSPTTASICIYWCRLGSFCWLARLVIAGQRVFWVFLLMSFFTLPTCRCWFFSRLSEGSIVFLQLPHLLRELLHHLSYVIKGFLFVVESTSMSSCQILDGYS